MGSGYTADIGSDPLRLQVRENRMLHQRKLSSDTSHRITTPTDQAFETLIELIDQREGARISAISTAALPVIENFRKGNQSAAKLQLESADEDAILGLSRLSTNFETLLGASEEE